MASALDDRIAFVTGATSGIGRAAALRLAEGGAHVALASRREDRLEAVADRIRSDHGREALAVPTDVTDSEQVRSAVTETAETFGGIDAVVANAGLGVDKDVGSLS
jgi:NADP-dependent 3-hydroxy acid dehydrogenase YdfG